jgi:lipopolysaccharide export system protein LptC
MSDWPAVRTPALRRRSAAPAGDPSGTAPPRRTGGYLAIERRRPGDRAMPSAGGLVRRRWLITLSKFLLPAGALVLLSTIALWPELDKATERARLEMGSGGADVRGARMINAHYRGVDVRGRPYTVTAATATRIGPNRVDLTVLDADITLANGTWINLKSDQGVFVRPTDQLDLSGHVTLYRDDGTTMTTRSAAVDIKGGAASGAAPTHVEGPFGTLDAAGFTTVDKGAAIEFWGPAKVRLNGPTK